MTGSYLAHCRQRLGLGVVAFGRALGFRGNSNTISVKMRRLEKSPSLSLPILNRLMRLLEERE